MQTLKSATFIGSGNVATHLAQALFHKGIKINQICSRLMENAAILATRVDAEPIDHIDNIKEDVDIIFCCTKDDLIEKISEKIARRKRIKSIVHTSGTVGLEVFKNFESKFEAVGIFYPLQTFSKYNAVDFSEIPIGITTTNRFFEAELLNIASKITKRAFVISDDDRQHLHLSAVLVNNFVNHLFAITQQYCKEHQLNFNLLKPLIHQTINKIDIVPAIEAQTGPAKRKDFNIINKHLSMLDDDLLTRNIYQSLTESILEMYHK